MRGYQLEMIEGYVRENEALYFYSKLHDLLSSPALRIISYTPAGPVIWQWSTMWSVVSWPHWQLRYTSDSFSSQRCIFVPVLPCPAKSWLAVTHCSLLQLWKPGILIVGTGLWCFLPLGNMFGILSGQIALLTLMLLSSLVTPGVVMLIWVRGVGINFFTFGLNPFFVFGKNRAVLTQKIFF